MLLFAKNFIRRLPKITDRSRFSRPVYRFSVPVRGTLAVRVYHVRPSTIPSPAVNRVPKVPVSSTPEIKSCPSVTDIPFSTWGTPPNARTRSTSPSRRATRLHGFFRSSGFGAVRRSRTSTLARQPDTFTATQLSSGISSSTWLRMSSPFRAKPKHPR